MRAEGVRGELLTRPGPDYVNAHKSLASGIDGIMSDAGDKTQAVSGRAGMLKGFAKRCAALSGIDARRSERLHR